jgi:hypothetical protein
MPRCGALLDDASAPNQSAYQTERCDHLQVHSNSDFDALSFNWWAYQRLARGSREERKALELGQPAEAQAALDIVAATVESGTADAVRLLVALEDDAPPDDDGVTVGSGPLEELITAHGRELADEIAKNARRSPSFARALSRVWLTPGHLDPRAEAQLSAWVPSLTGG